mgnify:FL=1
MSNKSDGNKFEQDYCMYLSKLGYYVIYNNGAAYSGEQPADIVAIKNNFPILIDCKLLENSTGRFPLSRIEANQRLAFKRFKSCGNAVFLLAILWNNDLYYKDMENIDFDQKSFSLKEMIPSIKDWRKYENTN